MSTPSNLHHLHEGHEDEFHNLLKKSEDKLVIVDFYATWCGPCKMIAPKFKEMANDFSDCVFIEVDVDEFEDIAEQNEVSCMPTFIFFRKGEKVGTFSGANPDKLRDKIKELGGVSSK